MPILPINNKMVTSATCESQVVGKQALITICTQGVEIEVPVLVIKKLVYDVIVGTGALNKLQATIDFANRTLKCTIEDKLYTIKLGRSDYNIEQGHSSGRIIKPRINYVDKMTDNEPTRNGQITQDKQRQLDDCLLYTSRCV